MYVFGFAICLIFFSLIISSMLTIYRKFKMERALKNISIQELTGADSVDSIAISSDGKDLIVKTTRSPSWFQRNS